jgi:HTH-type transcriptional regulator/antitoxin HigA
MEVRPIRTDADYRAMLREVSALVNLDPEIGSAEGDRLEVLSTLVQAWESQHYAIDAPDPVDAIKFRMEQAGLTVHDLEPLIGRSNRVYEVLARKRPLSMKMVRQLHYKLGIPAEALIGPPDDALAA